MAYSHIIGMFFPLYYIFKSSAIMPRISNLKRQPALDRVLLPRYCMIMLWDICRGVYFGLGEISIFVYKNTISLIKLKYMPNNQHFLGFYVALN